MSGPLDMKKNWVGYIRKQTAVSWGKTLKKKGKRRCSNRIKGIQKPGCFTMGSLREPRIIKRKDGITR